MAFRSTQHRLHDSGVEDHCSVVLRTPSGACATIELGYSYPDSPAKRHVHYTAAGDSGFVTVNTRGEVFADLTGEKVAQGAIEVDSDPLYGLFVERVHATYGTGFQGLPGLADLVESMRLLEICYASAK